MTSNTVTAKSSLLSIPYPPFSSIGRYIVCDVWGTSYSGVLGTYITGADNWNPDHLLITNSGGLPVGITPDNILVHEQKPRNPRLAEAFRRIGLVAQTGRGVDKIFIGQLRYGRPAPDYSRSDPEGVRVALRGGEASLDFSAFVF